MTRKIDKPTTSRKTRRATVAPHAVEAEPNAIAADDRTPVSADDRARMIAEHAYFLAAERGFTPGAELDDWLAAEREIDRRFAN